MTNLSINQMKVKGNLILLILIFQLFYIALSNGQILEDVVYYGDTNFTINSFKQMKV